MQTFGLSRNEAKMPASSSDSCFSSSHVAQGSQAVAKPVAKPVAKKKKLSGISAKSAAKILAKFQKKH